MRKPVRTLLLSLLFLVPLLSSLPAFSQGVVRLRDIIPNCPDTSGQHLNYTSSSGAFTCGVSSTSSSILTNAIINQAANGNNAITSTRATDTSPTGNFEIYKSAAGGTLWNVDITGSLVAGIVPVARVTGLAISATTDTTNASNISSGTIATARLGSGTANSTTFLRGDQTYAAPALADGWTHSGSNTSTSTSSDKVGIGTSSPDAPLTVSNNATTLATGVGSPVLHIGAADNVGTRVTIDSVNQNPSIDFRVASNTMASPSAVGSATLIGQLAFFAYGTTGYSAAARAYIRALTEQAFTDTSQGVSLIFATTTISTVATAEHMRIDGVGHTLFTGTAPTVACTGTGTSPAAPTLAGTDNNFVITINTGTGSPGVTGTCTVTLAGSYTNNPVMVCMLVKGAAQWGNTSTVQLTTESTTAPVLTWANSAVGVATALTVSTTYKINCLSLGRL